MSVTAAKGFERVGEKSTTSTWSHVHVGCAFGTVSKAVGLPG